ncbi:unnamed protein product, partial [marine sediment metagenome]
MSNISKVTENMQKKISLGDYFFSKEAVKKGRKIYTISKSDKEKLHAIFAKRLDSE